MPNNFVLLERIELNASAASITFANIPQTGYTDLKVVVSARDSIASDFNSLTLALNGSSASFTNRQLVGTGSAAVSNTGTTAVGPNPGSTITATTFNNVELYIPNYAGSANKSYSYDGVLENNATAARTILGAGLWSNTAAITSVTIGTDGTAFVANSTFSLYGLAALGTTPAIAPKASGGNVIATDGTYWYHAFRTSGTFTPAVGLTADCLVIAGGGGGGPGGGGGGGAGGLLGFNSQLLTATGYTVTVGAGGSNQSTGTDSQFGALTLVKGGGGGGQDGASGGRVGGSGGGGAGATTGASFLLGAAGTSGQGNAGGNGLSSSPYVGGGGGGASGSGTSGSGSVAGAGGTASSAYSTWASATSTGVSGAYAGGGGGASYFTASGGAGGGGGGGAGNVTQGTINTSGTANTGGGGGGNFSGTNAMSGGSGLVIIRYPIA